MSNKNHSQKFPFNNSGQEGQQQVPMLQQVYQSQQHSILGFEQKQMASLNQNGYGYYVSPQMPQYHIPPQQPTPFDSISSNNSISLNDERTKKKQKKKSSEFKKDKKKKRKRASSNSSSFSNSESSIRSRSNRSHSNRYKKKSISFLHNEDNWKCKYCYNINFRHRRECNRCKKSRQQADDKAKKYVPNPDDWRCNICGNFNFARRQRCNRCKKEKSQAIVDKHSE